jgi:hypothetical protein
VLFSDCITKDTPPPFTPPNTTFGYTPTSSRLMKKELATKVLKMGWRGIDLTSPLKELRSPALLACLFDQTHPSFGASAPNQRSVITFFRV